MIQDFGDGWYIKPEGDGLLGSLSEERPSQPCDARLREIDVALALDRLDEATDSRAAPRPLVVGRPARPSRSDRDLVLGPDVAEPTFSWFVGLGGFGIQTAPAAGELVAALALGEAPPAEVLAAGVDAGGCVPGSVRSACS